MAGASNPKQAIRNGRRPTVAALLVGGLLLTAIPVTVSATHQRKCNDYASSSFDEGTVSATIVTSQIWYVKSGQDCDTGDMQGQCEVLFTGRVDAKSASRLYEYEFNTEIRDGANTGNEDTKRGVLPDPASDDTWTAYYKRPIFIDEWDDTYFRGELWNKVQGDRGIASIGDYGCQDDPLTGNYTSSGCLPTCGGGGVPIPNPRDPGWLWNKGGQMR